MPPDIDQAKAFAQDVILAQGNVFIKELLRQKGLRLGATKADLRVRLFRAIDDGIVELSDLEAWAAEVEGWGQQHVKLWRVPGAACDDPLWDDGDLIGDRLRAAGFGDAWDRPTSVAFPEDLTLTAARYDGARLRLEWHRGGEEWIRDAGEDRKEWIGDDYYWFKAFRQLRRRSMTRFEFRRADGIAAAFVPASEEARGPILTSVAEVVGTLIPEDALSPTNISRAIGRLDENYLGDAAAPRSVSARFSAQGAAVEFSSTSAGHAYGEVDTIRNVRLAVVAGTVVGESGEFLFEGAPDTGPARTMRVHLSGKTATVWLRHQMTEGQAWAVLAVILGAEAF